MQTRIMGKESIFSLKLRNILSKHKSKKNNVTTLSNINFALFPIFLLKKKNHATSEASLISVVNPYREL